jgi:hypothetical protein
MMELKIKKKLFNYYFKQYASFTFIIDKIKNIYKNNLYFFITYSIDLYLLAHQNYA